MVDVVTTESWGSRIKGAFFGIIFGLALIIGSFWLIFWNEGHGLHTAQSLQQTREVVINVPNSPVDNKNNMKVIYFAGLATTTENLEDSLFNISENAIKLNRTVEMYQWKENKETKTEQQTGGSEKKTTSYTYTREWSDQLIDSNKFQDQNGHQNPSAMPVSSENKTASKVTVGDFALSSELIDKITTSNTISLAQVDTSAIQEKISKPVKHDGERIYIGEDPSVSQVGDCRITLKAVKPQNVSIIGQQIENTLQPYKAPAGQEVLLLSSGTVSAEQMILDAENENAILTWVLRGVSLVMMIVGIALVLQPLSVLASVLPFLGTIVEFGTGLIAFVLGIGLWAIATAIAWFTVRPVWSIGIIVIAGAICYLIVMKRKQKQITAETKV